MNRRQLFPFLTAPLLLPLAGCAKTYSWRQKLTVVVETPSGERTASSVSSVKWSENFFSHGWGGPQYQLELHGEAVAVDLDKGRFLFALMLSRRNYEYLGLLALEMLKNSDEGVWQPSVFKKVISARSLAPIDVPTEKYPPLITLSDTKDHNSIKKIEQNNLEEIYGKGFFLKRITLEITNAEVTDKIDKILPWLLDKNILDNPGWRNLPDIAQEAISGLRVPTRRER